MTPEKTKHHHRHTPQADAAKQAHLEIKNEEADMNARIDRLVSLTYDSDAQVRKNAAAELAKIDDPRSIFALLELSSDKDLEVKELALSNLNNFAHEKEAIVNLEKVFEARQQTAPPSEDVAAARLKLLPSIEKLFSNKDPSFKARLLPSILEKYFSSRAMGGQQAQPQHSHLEKIERIGEPSKKSVGSGEGADNADVAGNAGIEEKPANLDLYDVEAAPSQAGETQALAKPSSRLTPKQQGEEAADFPLPDALRQKTASPISEIESMMPETQKETEAEDEAITLHPNRIDFYKWAYALAVDPKMTQAKIRSEEKRLVTQLKKDVELAFRLAVKRAKTSGIESLSGLKPGMKKVATFPLLVVEVKEASIEVGKKPLHAMRIALSDGKHTVPLYLDLPRACGINAGDHVSLHDCRVDFFVESNELVFLTGKKGYISITK